MWTLQDAKNKFSSMVDAALAGAPQEVSRRGKPAVVVLSAADTNDYSQELHRRAKVLLTICLAFRGKMSHACKSSRVTWHFDVYP